MKFIALLALVLSSTIGFSQNRTLSGTIISENGEQLPYANLRVKNHNLGTISNGVGAFKLIVPSQLTSDSLLVSFIGYKPKAIKISDWTNGNAITLNQNSFDLAEVKITALSAEAILAKALKNIKSNYNQEAYKAEGFYRVTSKRDTNIIHLSEAVFELYQSQNDRPHQQLSIKKVRAIKDNKGSEGMDLGLTPEGIYTYDVVQHADNFNLLTKKGIKNHRFKLQGSEMVNGALAYKISFDQANDKFSGYKGTMYVDKETFAFVYFNFGKSPKGMEHNVYGGLMMRTLLAIMGLDIEMNKNNVSISYQNFNGKYYLNNVVNTTQMHFDNESEGYKFDADVRVDYLVTKVNDAKTEPFDSDEVASKNRLLQSKVMDYSSEFWDNYNIILPTDDYESIAKRIELRNAVK
jgi:hypothetical protein